MDRRKLFTMSITLNAASKTEDSRVSGRASLFLQVAGTMVAVVVFALVLTTLLNALRFQETFEDLVVRRLDVVVQEIASDLLVGLVDLGLPLEAMDNLDAIIERQVGKADGVAAVSIYDCSGRPLAMMHAAAAGGETSAAAHRHPWENYLSVRNWHRFDEDIIAVGMTFISSYGQCAGGIAVEYEAASFRKTRAAVIERLVWAALQAASLLLPALALLGFLFHRRHCMLRELRLDLEALTAQGVPDAADHAEPRFSAAGADRELLEAYHAARPVLAETREHLMVPAAAADVAEKKPAGGWFRAVANWFGNPVVQVLILTSITLLLALLFVSWTTAEMLRGTLLPELARKGAAQSLQAGHNVQRALDLSIPLDELVGVDALYDELSRDEDDLAFMAITVADGRLLHAGGMARDELAAVLAAPPQEHSGLLASDQSRRAGYLVSSLPLRAADGETVGRIHLGLRESQLARPIRDNFADLLIVLLVSLFIAFELMLLVVTINVILPLRATLRVLKDVAARRFGLIHAEFAWDELGKIARRLNAAVRRAASQKGIVPVAIREPRLVGVRLLAFLFVCAEELARPIMPAFFGQLTATAEGASSHFGAGGVMALHMAVVAVAMPLGSMLYARIGRRRMYAAGALFASIGLLGTGLADSIGQLLWWRAVSGLGYALTFVACQGFVIESTDAGNRARGSAMMVGGIMLADICGPAIGGILASWIGHAATFMLGAAVAALAAMLVTVLMDRHSDHADQPPRISLQAFALALRTPWLVIVLLFAAVPAKVVLSGLLYYLTPLALMDLGANEAQTGRILMLYGLVALLTGPLFAALTDRFQRPVFSLAVGGLVTAAGVIPMAGADSYVGVALGVLALGLAQSLSIPALVAAVLTLTQRASAVHGQGPVMAALRLVERLGGAAGPMAAAALANYFGIARAMEFFGFYVFVSTLLLLVLLWLTDRRRRGRLQSGGSSAPEELP